MSYPIDFHATRENGVRVLNSSVNPISGASSLLLFSDGTEWDMTAEGFRRSASIYLNGSLHDRGFSDGRIRTFIRRNLDIDQNSVWGGIFIVSELEGIGTREEPGQTRYEITDKTGDIQLIKYVDTLPIVLATSGVNLEAFTIYGFQVHWAYNSTTDNMVIEVSLGTNVGFTDLIEILSYNDSDSPNHSPSITEGVFVQSSTTDDIISYNFDVTSVYKATHL
jgi:hypothetical protein